MNFLELERQAYEQNPMPDNLELHQQQCFLALRNLYDSYRRGIVDTEAAMREKRLIRMAYIRNAEQVEQRHKLYKQVGDMRIRMAKMNLRIAKEGCPLCKEIVEILDGQL